MAERLRCTIVSLNVSCTPIVPASPLGTRSGIAAKRRHRPENMNYR